MFGDSAPETGHSESSRKGLRAYVLVSCTAFLVVGIYLGWTFWSRWEENQALEEKAASQRLCDGQTGWDWGSSFTDCALETP